MKNYDDFKIGDTVRLVWHDGAEPTIGAINNKWVNPFGCVSYAANWHTQEEYRKAHRFSWVHCRWSADEEFLG